MKRRDVVGGMAVGAGLGLIASPAVAQSQPKVSWRLTSAFPKSLDILYGTGELFAKYIHEATDGNFDIRSFAAGEIVGTAGAFDAVSNGTVECSHTALYYYTGKGPTFALLTSPPFGMNARQQDAWMRQGGGAALCNEYLARFNTMVLPGGNTGTQMGGWFRREVKTVEDFKGLKFRIAGMAGQVVARLGVVPQQIPAGEIYPALERGTIDAVEFSGPYDDEKLGFYRVAPFYYYPGFWEGGPSTHILLNAEKFRELPKSYQRIVEAAASHADAEMTAKYDTRNPTALRNLLKLGAQLRPFSVDIMAACYKEATALYDELSAKDPDFAKIYNSYRAFRDEEYVWFQVAEYSYDTFMIRGRPRG